MSASREEPASSRGFVTVKTRLKVWSNNRGVAVEDAESVILGGECVFVRRRRGELEVLSLLRHSSKARRLSSRLSACARVLTCVVVSGKSLCLYVFMFVYGCAFMCVSVLFTEERH